MILSSLRVENRASGFTVPEMVITERKILYQSPVHFTPLQSDSQIDEAALRQLVREEYRKAGIQREQVNTGAIIITGETSRKENAAAALRALSDFAGDFVVATAGPDLESRLSAKGAGATEYSEKTGETVLHIDIGGGTSNLSLIKDGKILRTGCLNVGGRLLKQDKTGTVTYRSPVLEGMTDIQVGDRPTERQLEQLAETLTSALEMAARLRTPTDILCKLTTKETGKSWEVPAGVIPSFSGGVADCIAKDYEDASFGDIGPVLGRAIRESALCRGEYFLGEETIRATVIGAGCHSVALSGSTVFYANVTFPLKNIPAVVGENPKTAEEVKAALETREEDRVFLAIPGYASPSFETVKNLAKILADGFGEREILVCLEADCAKALGQSIRLLVGDKPCICMDGLSLWGESYLDVGAPVGPALPVVMKTLVLGGTP
jgi:ethanolamine utilization protein EutA